MSVDRLRTVIERFDPHGPIAQLYGDQADITQTRYRGLLEECIKRFNPDALRVFSTPGRVELGGNHTDHNGGKVLAAAVQLDSIAMVEATGDSLVTLHSEGYQDLFRVDLGDLSKKPEEEGRTEALIRGVAARLRAQGYRIGGFHGCMTSNVLPGSGLSSSASVEMLIAAIFNHLFNKGSIDTTTLGVAGQYAENEFFGKPCGLMDQIACAAGGVVAIDFRVPAIPAIEQIYTRFADYGYTLVVCNTGGSHADLTPDYAAVPQEMRAVAEYFGKSVCSEISLSQVIRALPDLRRSVGDRAILRSLHFFADNDRVGRQVEALRDKDFSSYLDSVRLAGDSSWELLQNNYPCSTPGEQGVPLAIALSRLTLGPDAAVRIQGGGFAGTMQAYVPNGRLTEYERAMENAFGEGSVTRIRVRDIGATVLEY